jgi:hypothetical protein
MSHFAEVTSLLKQQISNEAEVADIVSAATKVSKLWVRPLSGGREETNGLGV